MKKTVTSLSVPSGFSFRQTVFSHGWCALPPFSANRETVTLERLLMLSDKTLLHCQVREQAEFLRVMYSSRATLTKFQRDEANRLVRSCLRLDEQFDSFYRYVGVHPQFRWIARAGAGRMLRAPSVFEDAVKMICTTNCSWTLTESMVANLVRKLGDTFDEGRSAFPTPAQLASVSETFVRKEIRAGYRAPYLIELAERVASGNLDIESWRASPLSTADLFRQMQRVKGIGAYAAGNLLKLAGRYDYLGLDSWVRAQYYSLYHHGRRVSDRTIERRYAAHGEWRGLLFWLEMTKHWFSNKFPM
jgi:3-methyladenine DNA glycosylase/8-oxoguanine DNA glycosylase